MSEERVDRRAWLKVVGGTIAGLIIGGVVGYLGKAAQVVEKTVTSTITTTSVVTVTPTVTPTPTPTPSPTKKRFEGVKLAYVSMSGPPADGVRVFAPMLKEKYGIELEVIDYPWEVYFSKLTTEFTAGKVSYDFVWLDTVFAPAFAELEILQPIDDLIERDKHELPPIEEFNPVHVDYAKYEGKYYGWFYSCNWNQLWVRKDLVMDPKEQEAFEKQYGYSITEFLEQPDWIKFNDVIEFFHRPPNLYGYTQPLIWPQLCFPAWHTRWFTCTGKPEIDENWDPWFDRVGELGVMSIELMKYQMKFMPPGILSMDNPDALAVYLDGKAAVMTGWDTFCLFKLEDPSVSKVVGKTMHLPPIGGPKGHCVYTNIGHMLGITTAVTDPVRREACWTVIKEVCRPENEVIRTLKAGQTPATKKGWKLLLEKRPDLPIDKVSEYFTHSMGVAYGPFVGDIITAFKTHVAAAVAGEKDTETALKDLAEEYRKMYEPYRKKGIKNVHGLTIPQWTGPDYTEELKKQIGM